MPAATTTFSVSSSLNVSISGFSPTWEFTAGGSVMSCFIWSLSVLVFSGLLIILSLVWLLIGCRSGMDDNCKNMIVIRMVPQ